MKSFYEIYKNKEAESMEIITNDNNDYICLMNS